MYRCKQIKETRKSVRDSESGIQKMAIGHHIGDRSHTIERMHNVHTKDKEQRQYFENLDESEDLHNTLPCNVSRFPHYCDCTE